MLPVGRLKVFKMVCTFRIQAFEVFGEDNDRVSNEEMGKVRGKSFIHAAFDELLLDFGVDDKVGVEIILS